MGLFGKKKENKTTTPTSSQPETPRSIADTTTSDPLNTGLAQSEPNTTPRSLISDISGAPTHTSVPESVVTKQVMPAIGNNSGKNSNPGSKPSSKPNSKPNSRPNSGKKAVSKPVSKPASNAGSKPNSRPNSGKNGTPKPISKQVSAKNSATKQKANSVMVHPTVHDISPNLPKINKNPTRKTMPAEHKLTPIVKIKSKQIRKKSAFKDERKSKVGNPGHRTSSTIYIPPSKLLKHLDPDEKSKAKEKNAKNSAKKQVLSTQVNRLLKQNTQDLFASLTHEVKRAFETLFDRIDVTDSGGITAKEIQQLIKKHTNKNLTLQQVQNVLRDLDVKGTGDIEFDEFIFMLSQPSNYVRLLDKRDLQPKIYEKYMKKQDDSNETTIIFFEALRNVTKQDSMTALHIRGFYKNRLKKLNDHVIHDWSAGQRCVGLPDQECLKRYETIQGELLRQRVNFSKDNSYKTSPYARPLEWGVMNLREAILERRTKAKELKAKKPEIKKACKPECVPAKTV